MTKEICIKGLTILALSFSVLVFIGCSFAGKSAAKNENPGGNEAKAEPTPTKTAAKTNTKLFSVNLIKNGGAEAGNSSSWNAANGGELKTFDYNGGWGDAWQVTPPNHGEKFFYVGVSMEAPALAFSQELDVSEIAKEVDANRISYSESGWFGVRGAAAGRVKVEFYDVNKALISRPQPDMDATEKITSANRPDDVTMIEKIRSGDVPAGTRKIKATLEFSLFENVSKDNNGESPLADNISLVLTDKGDK